MVWVDRIVSEIEKRFLNDQPAHPFPGAMAGPFPGALVIRDEKTLSGRVHVGSLRGIVIHALIAQALKERGINSVFKFELNDFDPMDGIPEEFAETHGRYMGQPLFTVPSPEAGHENFPMMFGDELKEAVEAMRLPIEWYTLRPLYEQGTFNDVIRIALDNAAEIRAIYREVSGSKKPDDWYPLSVVCEGCGKIGTTQVRSWDGERVSYVCTKDMVKWAEGCSHKSTISPFNGAAKLPFKVEWAAKWKMLGVQIEGCGKDHSAAGGSRHVAARISEEVFGYPNPFDIPYEFFNIAGKKMSASKGVGASAKEIAGLLPPALLKLLMIRTVPNRPIDFDPAGSTIPNLFDEYDRLSDHHFKRHPNPDPDFARTFRLAQLDPMKEPEDLWQMRFTTLSFILQMPHLDLVEEATKLKSSDVRRGAPPVLPAPRSLGEVGSKVEGPGRPVRAALTETEVQALNERARYVGKWLKELAPDEYKFTIPEKPPNDLVLDDDQKNALKKLRQALSDNALPWEGPKIHEAIHRVKEELGIEPKKLFQPLYQLFLGRTSGPQVGWFLSTFERGEVLKQLQQ